MKEIEVSNLEQEMIGKDIFGIEIISVRVDVPMLMCSSQQKVILTGEVRDDVEIKPEGSCQLLLASRPSIEEALLGAHIVFVVAGMRDDTRYGDAAIIAQIAREQGALSIAVVYEPSAFDNTSCQKVADEELRAMTSHADALFVIPKIQSGELDDYPTITSQFGTPGEIVSKWIHCIASGIAMHRLSYVGLNDFSHAMTGARKNGCAIIKPARGEAQGPDRAVHAAVKALAHPLFRERLSQADGMLFIITGNSENLMLCELNQISEEIRKHIPENCFK